MDGLLALPRILSEIRAIESVVPLLGYFREQFRLNLGITRFYAARGNSSLNFVDGFAMPLDSESVLGPLLAHSFSESGDLSLSSGDPARLSYFSVASDTDRLVIFYDPSQAEDHEALAVMVELFKYALTNLELLEQARRKLYRDELTGCYNLRYLDICLQREISRCRRFGGVFSVLFIDLDDFKTINDCYGHEAGNRALKAFAETLKKELREVDLVFRYGGDEFVAILLETTERDGLNIVQRLVAEFQLLQFAVDAPQAIRIPCSVGLACFPKHGATKEDLLRLADENMYHLKRQPKPVQAELNLFPIPAEEDWPHENRERK